MRLFPEMVGTETDHHLLREHGLEWDWQAYVSDPCATGLVATHNILHHVPGWNHKHAKKGMECPVHQRQHNSHGWYICVEGGIIDENGFHSKESLPVL